MPGFPGKERMLTLALDIGGTKIAAGLGRPWPGRWCMPPRRPTPKAPWRRSWFGPRVPADVIARRRSQAAGGGVRRGRHRRGPAPIDVGSRDGEPDQHRGLAASFPVARPGGRRSAGRAGAAGRGRRVHGTGRALARRRARCRLLARHGGLYRGGRWAGARWGALSRADRQCRTRRPRRGRARGAAVLVPAAHGWCGDRRGRAMDDAVGAGQRLGGAARRRRLGAGRSGTDCR